MCYNSTMKRVAVLRGGPSEEYEASMHTGRAVLDALESLRIPCKDLVITKQGAWLDSGFIRPAEHILQAIDIAFVALHGKYGEDGMVQKLLRRHNIAHTGSGPLASALAYNKRLTKDFLSEHNIRTPAYRTLDRETYESMRAEKKLGELFAEIGTELIVKPLTGGSSLGTQYVPHEPALLIALEVLFYQHEQVLVEEFIRGREATVGLLQNFRQQEYYLLPPIEIIPPHSKPIFSFEDKYGVLTNKIVPGRFSSQEKSILAEATLAIHKILNCRQYSRSDFIVRKDEVYFLEINTLPGLTPQSLYVMATEAVGLDYKNLIKHLVETAN